MVAVLSHADLVIMTLIHRKLLSFIVLSFTWVCREPGGEWIPPAQESSAARLQDCPSSPEGTYQGQHSI